MGVEEETSAAKSSDKTLYYNDGAMHYKGVEYELPTAVTVLKVPRFESANQKSTNVLLRLICLGRSALEKCRAVMIWLSIILDRTEKQQ